MNKENQNLKSGQTGDILASGTASILSLFPLTAPLGAMINFSLFTWQGEQLNKFKNACENRINAIDKNKLDISVLDSDEFKSLVWQAVEAASTTGSELKRQILAGAIVNSIVLPTSKVTGKTFMLRILKELSDEEINVLKVFYDERNLSRGLTKFYVANKLQLNQEDVLITCQALGQLGLLSPPNHTREHQGDPHIPGTIVLGGSSNVMVDWRITALAERLIQWCSDNSI